MYISNLIFELTIKMKAARIRSSDILMLSDVELFNYCININFSVKKGPFSLKSFTNLSDSPFIVYEDNSWHSVTLKTILSCTH